MAVIIFSMVLLGIIIFVFAEPAKAANVTRVWSQQGPDVSRLIAAPNDILDVSGGTSSVPCVASAGAPTTSCVGGSCAFDGTTLYFCGDSGSWSPISGGGGSTAPYYVQNFFSTPMWATAEETGGGLWTTAGPMLLLSSSDLSLIGSQNNITLQSAENIQLITAPVGDGSVVQVAGVLDLQYQDSTWDGAAYFDSSEIDPGFALSPPTKEDLLDADFMDDLLFQLRNVPDWPGLLSWRSTITLEGAAPMVPKLLDLSGTMNLDHLSAYAGINFITFQPTINYGSGSGTIDVSLGVTLFNGQARIVNEYPASNPYIVEGGAVYVDQFIWEGSPWSATSIHNSYRSSPVLNTNIGRATAFSCGGTGGTADALGGRYCLTAMEWSADQLANGYEAGVSLQAGMDAGIINGSPLVEPPSQPTINGNRPLTIDAAFMLVTNSVAGVVNIMSLVPGIDGQYAQIMNKTANFLLFLDGRTAGPNSNTTGFLAASCGTPNGGTTMCSGGSPTGGGCLLQQWDSIEVRYSSAADSWIQTGCAQIQSGYATYSIADLEVAAE
jgi:hypothetical protein